MADNENYESGSKDRATVALVDAKLDGVKELIRAEFAFMRERIEPLASLVQQFSLLKARVEDHEQRLDEIEKSRQETREYRRVQLPLILFGGVGAAGVIFTIVTQVH